jgi:hypothetical protein
MIGVKIAVFVSVALLLRCAAAHAGAVQISLLNDDELLQWKCGAAMPAGESQSKVSCETAKYEQTSSCPTVAIANDSTETVKVRIQLTGHSFEQSSRGGNSFAWAVLGGDKCHQLSIDESCDSLAPGHSCAEAIQFSPERSGISDGHLEVLVTGSGKPFSKAYDLIGTADYPPELLAVDEVIKRHLDELMRIPHVVRVSIDDSDDGVIQVEVAHEEDVAKVERSVPPKLEGYRVDVVEEIRGGWGL